MPCSLADLTNARLLLAECADPSPFAACTAPCRCYNGLCSEGDHAASEPHSLLGLMIYKHNNCYYEWSARFCAMLTAASACRSGLDVTAPALISADAARMLCRAGTCPPCGLGVIRGASPDSTTDAYEAKLKEAC